MDDKGNTRLRRALTIIFLTIPLTAMVSYFAMPGLHRARLLSGLASPDPTQRAPALRYIIHKAASEPAVLKGAVGYLEIPDADVFLEIVDALDAAGQWQQRRIPPVAWMRWLKLIGTAPDPIVREIAAQRAVSLVDNDPLPVLALLTRLIGDEHQDVRYEALLSAAVLAGATTDPTGFKDLITQSTQDTAQAVAHQAWIFAGLIQLAPPLKEGVAITGPSIWAAQRADPRQSRATVDVFHDKSISPAIRAMAAYALSYSTAPDAVSTLVHQVDIGPDAITQENQRSTWRAILGLSAFSQDPGSNNLKTLLGFLDRTTPDHLAKPLTRPVVLACLNAAATLSTPAGNPDATPTPQLPNPALLEDPMARLAWLEGLRTGDLNQRPASPTSRALMRLALVRAASNPQPQMLYDLLSSPESAMRDIACLVASTRLSIEQLQPLIVSLLNDFNDDAKCSGAVLSGLTGLETDLLQTKANREDIWSVRQVMRLGLWMSRPSSATDASIAARLTRDDLPTTTFLLGMLHNGHPQAWDYLLNPRHPGAGQRLDPLLLIDHHRWWYILQHHLNLDSADVEFTQDDTDSPPPRQFNTTAPRYWLWADRELQQFQIDVMRAWYLLNSVRLQRTAAPYLSQQ